MIGKKRLVITSPPKKHSVFFHKDKVVGAGMGGTGHEKPRSHTAEIDLDRVAEGDVGKAHPHIFQQSGMDGRHFPEQAHQGGRVVYQFILLHCRPYENAGFGKSLKDAYVLRMKVLHRPSGLRPVGPGTGETSFRPSARKMVWLFATWGSVRER